MPENDIKAHELSYKEILAKGKIEYLQKSSEVISKKTGKPVKSNAQRLLEKFEEYDIETLSLVKLRQNISGSFRGDNGGKWFCRLRSYASTCRKNGQNVMEAWVNAIKGEPFIPET